VHVSAPLEAAPRPGAFGILSIAVDPLCQGMGVAALLMADSEQTAREWGFSEMSLTVAMENQRAIRFYEKQGWRRVHLGEAWEGYMTKDLGTRLSGTGTNHA
jgi:ribosomal protein S18 acetylase RimI-like enzyme